jgi:hypothetical protein
MGRAQPSFVKRQREQQKREKAAQKAEKRAQRQTGSQEEEFGEVVRETPIEDVVIKGE